jgi:uncharacterized Zn-binding protein involved in type VI secretion
MSQKFITRITLAFVLFLSLAAFKVQGQATIKTDLLDYPPGSTAIITGTGFQPGETVTLQVVHVDGDSLGTDEQYHQPFTTIADGSGNVSTAWWVPDDGDALGASFKLTANGQSSGLYAEWFFTDNGNFTYVTTLKNNGTFDVSLSFATLSGTTIGIGTGASQINLTSIINNYVTGGSGGSAVTKSFPVTVSVGSSVPNGPYSFEATAIPSPAGQPNPGGKWQFTVTVGSGSTGGSIASVSIGSQSGTSTYGAASTPTYNVTSLRGSNGSVNGTYSVSGLPSGVTGNFSLTTFSVSGSTVFPTTILTLNVPASLGAGSYSFSVSLTDGANSASNTGTLVVDKAASVTTVTINGTPFTYTGSAITPASVTVTGAGSLSLTPAPVYANNTNAGTATASYTFAGDANHLGSSDSKNFTIDKAASVTTVTITGAPFTYTGSVITPASVTVTGAGSLSLTPAPVYANNIDAGVNTASASYSYPGDANQRNSE